MNIRTYNVPKGQLKDKNELAGDIGRRIGELRDTPELPITTLTEKLVETPYFCDYDEALRYILKTVIPGEFYDKKEKRFASEIDYDRMAALLFELNFDTDEELVAGLRSLDKDFFYDKELISKSDLSIHDLRIKIRGSQEHRI